MAVNSADAAIRIAEHPSLPQNITAEAAKQSRKAAVDAQRELYKYKYDGTLPGAPKLAEVHKNLALDPLHLFELPHEEAPTFDWRHQVKGVLLHLLHESNEEVIKEFLFGDPAKSFELFSLIISKPERFDQRPTDISDYTRVFDTDHLPRSVGEVKLDEAFCRWRLAGPNPMMIAPATRELLDAKANLNTLPADVRERVNAALAAKRLFACDYTILATLKTGNNEGVQKYNVAPLALFEMPEDEKKRHRQWLEPLAIQCEAKSKRADAPMFTPKDGVKWTIAKAAVNSADGDYHESVVHLGHTHRVSETFVVATHRTLPPAHPLFVLLIPHFEGTAFINHAADTSLVNPKGGVDRLVNQEIFSLNEYIGTQILDILSGDFSFPGLIKGRNMNVDTFPAPFPYRDDGILVWNAVRRWVEAYLNIYYGTTESETKANIEKDTELQAWINELKDAGRVGWLKEFDGTLKMLADVVAAVIFTGSAQHAAVNFPQKELESYVPAYPLAFYKAPPNKDDETTHLDYLDTLPPMQMASLQRKVAYLLGGVHYTKLGDYNEGKKFHLLPSGGLTHRHFVDPRVDAHLKAFQDELAGVETKILERNKERVAAWRGTDLEEVAANWAYEYMLPSKIPQSVNI
jgi:arachidonate 15-lipoxygenase